MVYVTLSDSAFGREWFQNILCWNELSNGIGLDFFRLKTVEYFLIVCTLSVIARVSRAIHANYSFDFN